MRRDALTTFTDLGVLPSVAESLERLGITEAFPIQEMALPVALTGTDLIGQARTGTGKTLAFGIPLLQRIVAPGDRDYAEATEPGKPQALVVTPTRELAVQVSDDLVKASTTRQVRILTVYGGRAYEPQLDALAAGVDVVVGTPGRLLDLARRGDLDLGHVKVLVLDEADEMLDLGFLPDVESIIGQTPELRQTMLFSATMPAAVISLARRYMRHPVNIRAESPDETQTVPATAQFVYRAHQLDKEELIARLLQAEGRGLSMIFSQTKRAAQRLADELKDRGFAAAAVHGDLGQGAREQALRAFRSGKVDVLVATGVAARGIDVEGVTHVVNLTCPEDEKTYLHRIGRTGRAGASGVAVTLVDWDDLARWRMINDALGLPYPEPVETYSSSEHFFHDLGIPAGTKGALPRGARTRAGLDAEQVEDLGETGQARSRRSTGASRNRRRTRRGESTGGGRTQARTERREGDEARPNKSRQRKRRRTRGGQPVDSEAGASSQDQPRDESSR
ncbi:superfamily II DNA/RNA helicase [Haloactinopolyspora alba]|uniref:RNA helicase n=1 Tax=Haloactinopolyspora alba TaxID=648780 RepID=A0A2P8DXG0_9ACTN|nr:DEAD/DEAH box helicase [Haloactinopolyspora alba]PSL01896.1 superfamily II DNA/RNA helicase [Haloactinopolyspora alba]